MSISLIFISASYPFSCKDAVFLIQFNPDIMPVVSYCHKPCCAASKNGSIQCRPLDSLQGCTSPPASGIRCKMISPVRHCVDQPHIPAVPDRRNVAFLNFPAFRGLLSFCIPACPGTSPEYLWLLPRPPMYRLAVSAAIGSGNRQRIKIIFL